MEHVVLDRAEGEEWWSATAHIVKDGQVRSVDVRPSDACILAVIENVPIPRLKEPWRDFADREKEQRPTDGTCSRRGSQLWGNHGDAA